jgi:hypothetical protein
MPRDASVLDFCGGFSLLCRLLRDRVFNARVSDVYATTDFAQGFEDDGNIQSCFLYTQGDGLDRSELWLLLQARGKHSHLSKASFYIDRESFAIAAPFIWLAVGAVVSCILSIRQIGICRYVHKRS